MKNEVTEECPFLKPSALKILINSPYRYCMNMLIKLLKVFISIS